MLVQQVVLQVGYVEVNVVVSDSDEVILEPEVDSRNALVFTFQNDRNFKFKEKRSIELRSNVDGRFQYYWKLFPFPKLVTVGYFVKNKRSFFLINNDLYEITKIISLVYYDLIFFSFFSLNVKGRGRKCGFLFRRSHKDEFGFYPDLLDDLSNLLLKEPSLRDRFPMETRFKE